MSRTPRHGRSPEATVMITGRAEKFLNRDDSPGMGGTDIGMDAFASKSLPTVTPLPAGLLRSGSCLPTFQSSPF